MENLLNYSGNLNYLYQNEISIYEIYETFQRIKLKCTIGKIVITKIPNILEHNFVILLHNNHFIILEHYKSNGTISVLDPSKGKIEVHFEMVDLEYPILNEFGESYALVILVKKTKS